jgi:uncharacterized DUF497 family protein
MIEVKDLLWDAWNVVHIARHEVTPEEVEEVCAEGGSIEAGYAGCLRLVGPTRQGRILAVVLAPKGNGIYYPVTARPASRKERRRYKEGKGGEQAA